MSWSIIQGDCREILKTLEENSVDAVVCDPPYELGFMGKVWDKSGVSFDPETWREVLRVLKPGGHLLAFGGTRTYHRMACAIEDADFEIRDSLHWIYGTGFPKSLDISKAIDKAAGVEREILGPKVYGDGKLSHYVSEKAELASAERSQSGRTTHNPATAPATEAAKQWSGWGTALKPAHDPIILARKPLVGTVAANVLEYGTGGLNVDGCRITTNDELTRKLGKTTASPSGWVSANRSEIAGKNGGRWPANVILSDVDDIFGNQSKFFYCAKSSRCERDAGCETLPMATPEEMTDRENGSAGLSNPRAGAGHTGGGRNTHPTVKPVALMRWLVRLVTPPSGVVLDPFCGSGTTGVACIAEGFDFLGIELEEKYVDIAKTRLTWSEKEERK